MSLIPQFVETFNDIFLFGYLDGMLEISLFQFLLYLFVGQDAYITAKVNLKWAKTRDLSKAWQCELLHKFGFLKPLILVLT